MSPPPFVSPQVYTDYYTRQVGNGLPVYAGGAVQQGFGLGSLIVRGLRSAIPFLRPMVKKGGQAILKKALSKGGKKLAREALGAGVGIAANALKDHMGSRKNMKRKRPNTDRKNTKRRRRGGRIQKVHGTRAIGHKRKSHKPTRLSRPRVNVQRRAPDIFDE